MTGPKRYLPYVFTVMLVIGLGVPILGTLTEAQQPGIFGPQKPVATGELPKCSLVFLQGNLAKVLLQVEGGQVLLDTKEYVIEIQPGRTPVATCKLYRGVYRPSTPITKTWEVAEIKFVETDQFQKLIDEAVATADDEPFPAEFQETPIRGKPPIAPTIPLNPNEVPPKPPAETKTKPADKPDTEAKTKAAPVAPSP